MDKKTFEKLPPEWKAFVEETGMTLKGGVMTVGQKAGAIERSIQNLDMNGFSIGREQFTK